MYTLQLRIVMYNIPYTCNITFAVSKVNDIIMQVYIVQRKPAS
jgi:hypothetical protein